MNPDRYRCKHNSFTSDKYNAFIDQFWRLPSAWQLPGSFPFSDLPDREGRAGVVKLLPLLGYAAGLRASDDWVQSLESAAQLCGLDVRTCSRARDAFEAKGLVKTWIKPHLSQPVTHWSISSGLAAPPNCNDVFLFQLKLIYGGIWARMQPVECAIYMAAATRAHTFASVDPVARALHWKARYDDVERGLEATGKVRVAVVSQAQLRLITGYSEAAIGRAVRSIREAGYSLDDPREHVPIGVYETHVGSLLYHFRDHVDPIFDSPRSDPARSDERAEDEATPGAGVWDPRCTDDLDALFVRR